MKVLLVACFALLSVASGFPTVSQWTLHELSEAIQDPNTHPLMMPYLESALNDMMTAMFHGYDQKIATIVVPADVAAAMNPINVEPVVVEPVIVDGIVSQWTLHELSEAIQDPNTHHLMMPYLEHALNEMMTAMFNGEQPQYATIVVPVDVAAAMNPVVVEPVSPMPVLPEGVAPVLPVEQPKSSPLVQIILNINANQASSVPVETPVAPVVTLPAEVIETPVAPVAPVVTLPEVVGVAHLPEVVQIANPVNPIDNVAVEPTPVNPIDIVAIEPMPVNPIDTVAIEAMPHRF